jgi:hypothetical protein
MKDLFSPTGETVLGGERLLLSVSGGKTSAYMTRQVLTRFAHLWNEVVTVFANTGEENEQTLEFVRDCDRIFGFRTVWVEADVNPEKRAGTKHKVVTFETASRHGEPFEAVIAKYGIPNMKHPHCTRELKQRAIESYAASLGWGKNYVTAIGIRPDEARRVNAKAAECLIAYPLVDWFYADKQDVNDWWDEQPFNLQLQEHQGNCKWCWKKSFAKHARLFAENPENYAFPERMEAEYGYVGPDQEPDAAFPRTFFRGNRSTLALKMFISEIGTRPMAAAPDENAGCGESCELYSTNTETLNLFETVTT